MDRKEKDEELPPRGMKLELLLLLLFLLALGFALGVPLLWLADQLGF